MVWYRNEEHQAIKPLQWMRRSSVDSSSMTSLQGLHQNRNRKKDKEAA